MSGALGAEVKGINLKDSSDKNFKIINDLLLEHKVIFFRNQEITTEEHKALAKKFGPLEKHAYVKGRENHPPKTARRCHRLPDFRRTPSPFRHCDNR